MKRKMIVALIGVMALSLMACGKKTALSNSTKQLTSVKTENQTQTAETVKEESNGENIVENNGETSIESNGENNDEGSGANISQTADFKTRYNQFAINLLQQTYQTGKNEMISPLSVLAALTMTENGANGETLTQMEQVLSGGTDRKQQGTELSSYMNSLTDTENSHLNIANSIWVKDSDSLHVNNDFLNANEQLFQAEVYQAPFDDSTLKDINTWVSNETEQMIPQILDKINSESVMYLINAVAFDAKWRVPYEKEDVTAGVFTTENGNRQDVDIMHSTESIYLEDENTTGFLRPYEEGYYFMAMLPAEGTSMEDYVNTLSAEKFKNLLENAGYNFDVDTVIPRFKSEYSVELKDTLETMGMTDAFDEEKADFSGIGSSDNGNIYISKVIHKTFIEVDEQGTKAGAATVVGMEEATSLKEPVVKTVYLDRPFVYAIIDSESELPVFLGVTEVVEQ